MLESLTSGLQMLLATLGLLVTPDLGAMGAVGAMGALGVTIAVASFALVLVALLAVALTRSGRASPAHPSRAIDISSPLSQSDPDASGHPRPRAPGHAAWAA